MKESIVQNKSFQFSLKVISQYKKLHQEKEFIISKQLLRSGTSIGANIEEALAGQSKRDFIAKMSISSKEARETKYWLRLLKESDLTNINVNDLLSDAHELIRLLTAIIKTSQQNTTKN
ncbi:four helix bundle protein [Tenacibaculum aiptasiae]|uniref:Four helix bundle protein n=1 Tax=Tenacibaculum aiptasiae TaxID=426481 RepID=A0A7J5ASE6_9FLAO|nr:four helix bundle protein [Tenacibaculum aiptasiae]KAB1160557.1 four helix bundle protein [Tenacibaculum aiptasiae]